MAWCLFALAVGCITVCIVPCILSSTGRFLVRSNIYHLSFLKQRRYSELMVRDNTYAAPQGGRVRQPFCLVVLPDQDVAAHCAFQQTACLGSLAPMPLPAFGLDDCNHRHQPTTASQRTLATDRARVGRASPRAKWPQPGRYLPSTISMRERPLGAVGRPKPAVPVSSENLTSAQRRLKLF